MDVYLRELYRRIIYDITVKVYENTPCVGMKDSTSLHELVQEVEGLSDIIFNFNEEGRLHSKYSGDRYEPAIIIVFRHLSVYYYLFDGEIKDCIHPFSIQITKQIIHIDYYSSDRIEQELPISIIKSKVEVDETYNQYKLNPLLARYKSGSVKIKTAKYPKQDYFLHDCMEPLMPFKFAD